MQWICIEYLGMLRVHYQLCYTSGLHHNLTILLSASLSNLQRIRRNFSGEDVTASKALVCRTPQARHAPPTQDDGHPMPPVSPVCHRRPVIAVSTSSPFCARNLAHELEELLRSRPPLTVGLIRQRDEVIGPCATHRLEPPLSSLRLSPHRRLICAIFALALLVRVIRDRPPLRCTHI